MIIITKLIFQVGDLNEKINKQIVFLVKKVGLQFLCTTIERKVKMVKIFRE